jgi:HD-like signal output (HDOD) protein
VSSRVLTAKSITSRTGDPVRRKNRLTAILANGLPPFEHTVLQLNAILDNPVADIKKAAKPIRTDPALSGQVLRMCNSPLFGRRGRVISIEQAAILLGADRLRSLAVTSSLVGFAGKGLPKDQLASFWKHGFFAAMLSKHLAKFTGYPEAEQAYIAGLLHDIGQVPQWMLAAEDVAKHQEAPPIGWFDNPAVQREYLGIDHCELGSQVGKIWDLMPSFIDVILNHHEPQKAQHDPCLVQIVGGVEHFLLMKQESASASAEATDPSGEPKPSVIPPVALANLDLFAAADWQTISAKLESEYERLLPLVEETLKSTLGLTN